MGNYVLLFLYLIVCCGKDTTDKNYGITASGKRAKYGYVACNWLKFGTKLYVDNLGIFKVQDRGSKKYFGSKDNPIKHIDIWLSDHRECLNRGKEYRNVIILDKK